MKFSSYCMKFKKDNHHLRIAYNIINGNHTYPTHLSSKTSMINWCNRNINDPNIIASFNSAWDIFASKPFATIQGGKRKPRVN